MPRYDLELAKAECASFCRSPFPRTRREIALHLKQAVPGFYPNSLPSKFIHLMERDVLAPLLGSGLIVAYAPEDACWHKVAGLLKESAKRRGTKAPRGVDKAFQAHFLHLQDATVLPGLYRLPAMSKEMNVDLVALLHGFDKPSDYSWQLLNLLLCARTKNAKDALRIHLYRLPLDYDDAELLEDVLEYGNEFASMQFPLRPDFEEAKRFLDAIAGKH
jgi:hypothetical protein